jgi:hypothetical protein
MNEPINGRDTGGRFARGNSGRKRGSRSKLGEKFLADLQRQWQKSGREVLEKVVATDPVAFLKCVAHILPKEIDSTLSMNVSVLAEIHEMRNFSDAYSYALRHIGAIEHKAPKLIESGNGNDDSHTDD